MPIDPAREAEIEADLTGFTGEIKDDMTVAQLRVVWMRYIRAGHKRLAVAFLGDARKTVRPSSLKPATDVTIPQ